eukprot:628624-Pyramimonas_sp.AAC.1
MARTPRRSARPRWRRSGVRGAAALVSSNSSNTSDMNAIITQYNTTFSQIVTTYTVYMNNLPI